MTTLPTAASFGQRGERLAHLVERVHRGHVRPELPRVEERVELLVVALLLGGRVLPEGADLEALHDHALQQHEVQRDARDLTRREPERDEPAAPAGGAERLLRVRAADRVEDHVGAAARDLLDALLQVLGLVVDHRLRARGAADLELLGRRRRREHASAAEQRQLDAREADAARRAEHDDPVAGFDLGHAADRVVGGGVDHAERGRLRAGDAVGYAVHGAGRQAGVLRERTDEGGGVDAVTGLEIGDVAPDRRDHARRTRFPA